MGEGSLSQEDIDALLESGAVGGDEGGGGGGDAAADDMFAGLTGETGGGGGDVSASDLNDLDSLLGGGMNEPSSDAVAAALGPSSTPAPPKSTKSSSSSSSNTANLNLLMDVTMSLTIELGRTHKHIRDVLLLSEGAIVELDKNVGEELDILANGKLIGKGRLIILDDYYAVQITQIIDPMARLKQLQQH
ncbi:MAG: flagellar motor switch protein FliN [Spirochaetota bacterium]